MFFVRVYIYMVYEIIMLCNGKECLCKIYYKLLFFIVLVFFRKISIWKRKSMCLVFFFFFNEFSLWFTGKWYFSNKIGEMV